MLSSIMHVVFYNKCQLYKHSHATFFTDVHVLYIHKQGSLPGVYITLLAPVKSKAKPYAQRESLEIE